MLLQVRCHCTSGVVLCVWKDVEWAVYVESTYSVCCYVGGGGYRAIDPPLRMYVNIATQVIRTDDS